MAQARQSTNSRPPVSIGAVIDCVGALATRSLSGNLYLYDTNKSEGSAGFGTEELRTTVRVGDKILWTVLSLECEAYVGIDSILIDHALCEPERRVYPGTDVAYWTGTLKAGAKGAIPYQMKFKVGARTEPMTTPLSAVLVAG
ncbi:hypothetical protein [Streptomyces sp. NPDC048172]|uniref:hypothetical protein n=1 Tax=Streptomyces sp. NPDC048172 TaxID=3365505 RepID=UPI0037159E55